MDINNPFLNQSPLDLPFQLKHCQRIHWTALRTATTGMYSDVVPEHLNLDQLKNAHKRMGYDAYLLSPNHIEKIFSGFRLAHFRTIEALYCSHLELGIKTVYSILGKMAEEAKLLALSYEAIWAVCLFLEKKRQKDIARVIKTNSIWQLVILKSDALLRRKNRHTFSPKIVCVIDTETLKVLAYYIMDCDDNNLDKGIRRAIYDALVMNRKPAVLAPSGLEWYIPGMLHTDTGFDFAIFRILSEQLQIEVQSKTVQNRLLDILHGKWDADLAGRVMSLEYFDRIFDNYLHRMHGYGPKRTQAHLAREYASLIGYSTDPASLFPALRSLLPEHHATISSNGEIVFDGLHFTNSLLKYWPGQRIILRRSLYTESTAWIYLDGEILCEARARELRKPDGTHRKTKYRSSGKSEILH